MPLKNAVAVTVVFSLWRTYLEWNTQESTRDPEDREQLEAEVKRALSFPNISLFYLKPSKPTGKDTLKQVGLEPFFFMTSKHAKHFPLWPGLLIALQF